MKYRKDFVTNSSSSSFICDVCGDVESGYDASLSDFGMCECVNGHTFCRCHSVEVSQDKLAEILSEYRGISIESAKEKVALIAEYYDDIFEAYDYPEELCPICQMESIGESDILQYLCKKYKINRKDIKEEMKNKFVTIDKFEKWCNAK